MIIFFLLPHFSGAPYLPAYLTSCSLSQKQTTTTNPSKAKKQANKKLAGQKNISKHNKKPMNKKISWSLFCVNQLFWAWGLSWSMVGMPSDSPLPKTNFLFRRRYQFQITFWLGVGLVSPQCWDFVWLAYVQYCAFCCSPRIHMCSVLLCLEDTASSESPLSASSEPGGESCDKGFHWDSLF